LKKKNLFLLLLLLNLYFYSFSSPLKIKELNIEGNKKISTGRINLLLKSKVSGEFDEEVLKEDIKRLGETGYFSELSYKIDKKEGEVYITIYLKENPIVSKINFTGNRIIKTKDLKKYIGVSEGEVFNETKINNGINEIKKKYEEKGIFFTEVNYNTELKDDNIIVNVKIKEAKRACVYEINFKGNNSFPSSRLKSLMKTKERKMPIIRGTFKPEIFEKDLKSIEKFYRKNGFLDMEITDKSIIPQKKEIKIEITINEGKQYFLGKIFFKGELIFDENVLRDKLIMKKEGEVFDEEKSEQNVTKIKKLYFDAGYIKALIDVIPTKRENQQIIDLTYVIKPGKVFSVEEVKIKGNTKTKDKVIRRELVFSPGDKFSGEKVTKSFNNLRDLNYFENINIYPEYTEEVDKANMVVEVKEREKTGMFMIGGGYSSIDQLLGFISIEQTNFDIKNPPSFVGGGQDIKLWLQMGSTTRNFNLSFTEPYFLDKPVWFGTDIYNLNREWDDYTEERLGGDIRFGRRWEKYSLGFKMTSEKIKLSDIEIPSIQSEEGTYRKNALTTNFEYISLDSKRYPTKGNKANLGIEYSGGIFQGDLDFVKTNLEENFYYPINKFIIHTKTLFGIVEEIEGTEEIPIFERFFAGGIGTVRGYKERTLSPKDPTTGEPIGGKILFAQNFELMYPIYQDILKGIVFFDIGNVWDKWEGFDDLKKGVGIGFRIFIPFLSTPVQLDYGIALDREEGEPFGRFHIGMSFGF